MLLEDSLLSKAYSPSLFAAASAEWQSRMTFHWTRMQHRETTVLNWNDPQELIRDAEGTLQRKRDEKLK